MHAIEKVDPRRKEFKALVQRGVEAWVHAGKLLVAMTAENPNALEEIMADNPLLSRGTLETFLRIGRMEVLPMLLVNPSPGAQRLARLPYLIQTRLWNQEVFVERLNSKVPIDKLTPGDAAVVLGPAGARSPQEQRALLRSRSVAKERASRPEQRNGPVEKTDKNSDSVESSEIQQNQKNDPNLQQEEAGETDPADECLRIAQNALLAARVKMREAGNSKNRSFLLICGLPMALDDHITIALRMIGKVRFELGEASKN